MRTTFARTGVGMVGAAAILAAALAGTATAQGDEPVTLSYLVDDTQNSIDTAEGLAAAYTALHPNVTIDVSTRPGGTEGDNLVKNLLATGDMADIFWYNAGSLFQALNPTETLVDLSGEPFIANIAEAFLPTVSAGDGVYGVPVGTAMGGGILYNRKIYADLGLSVPTTWAEFAANNEAIKAAGIAPVGATFADTWTSQLFVLADYFNVQAEIPDFADQYTNNKIKYATTPVALAGFERLQEAFEKGWWQEDFGSAKLDDGLNLLAEGQIAHYPMLTFTLSTIAANHPDAVADIGFMAQPGDGANGATIWMPAGTYIPKTTEAKGEATLAAAKDFLGFIASVPGTEAQTAAVAPQGPYVVNGAALPADTLPAVLDVLAYLDANAAAPALEFVSPIKGPALENITVEVGSGLRSAADGAALYDQDVEKQAKQLGIPGW